MARTGSQRHFASRDEWRAWLQANHAVEKEMWLIFYKKHTGRAGLAYEDAIEEALCFGWIDGILKRIDDEKHTIRFSPRRPRSVWSETNKRRVHKLIKEGRMTEAGLAKIEAAKKNGQWNNAAVQKPNPEVPPELAAALARNRAARRNFENLAPSYRRRFVYWIAMAKREETRRKRVAEVIGLLARNKKLGMK
jgi:uncharacterized protein YdeI (YjbR/CyaY-like superfamily)